MLKSPQISDGFILYEKESWEPPRDIEGYKRDPNNPFCFYSLWPDCLSRELFILHNDACHCARIVMQCHGQTLKLKGCEICQNRK
jgi:hypothetical protein